MRLKAGGSKRGRIEAVGDGKPVPVNLEVGPQTDFLRVGNPGANDPPQIDEDRLVLARRKSQVGVN